VFPFLYVVAVWANCLRFSWPRMCVRYLSSMMKLEANIEAVILWQSAQLHTKEPTRPGPWVGWEGMLET